jgi:gas vesicle protein
MANFLKLNARTEQRIGEYATRLLRIEAHIRRGEKRAAAARLVGFRQEIAKFMHELEFPLEMTIIGSQLGFFSGKGSFLTGRLPGAIVGAMAGWLFGQSQTSGHHRYLVEIYQRVDMLEQALIADAQADRDGQSDQTDPTAQPEEPASKDASKRAESA